MLVACTSHPDPPLNAGGDMVVKKHDVTRFDDEDAAPVADQSVAQLYLWKVTLLHVR
jgi:hypothetical protein